MATDDLGLLYAGHGANLAVVNRYNWFRGRSSSIIDCINEYGTTEAVNFYWRLPLDTTNS